MKSFLEEVAERIISEQGDDMSRVAVVFNNSRPAQYLRKALSALIDRPFFLPTMMGMNDFVSSLCHLRIEDPEFLLFELYDVHRHMENTTYKYETFEEFISFGEIMLGDFSEIDLYMADAEQLFGNLRDLKAVEEWDISGKELTPFQRKYLAFYASLIDYYRRLRQRLRQRAIAYSGMAYRHTAEHIDDLHALLKFDHVYFVGFNALSTSERRIIRSLARARRATLISDGDDYYYRHYEQEAGLFLRRNAKDFPLPHPYDDHFAAEEKSIRIVSCPENVMQTKYAARRLEELLTAATADNGATPQADPDRTAIVLADEKLLVPMLNALPAAAGKVNVSLGYPYAYSTINALAIKIIELHSHAREELYHHREVTALLCDPYMKALLGTQPNDTLIALALEKNHAAYADSATLTRVLADVSIDISPVAYLFAPCHGSTDALLLIWQRCIDHLQSANLGNTNPRDEAALAQWRTITDYLVTLQDSYHYIESLTVLQRLYSKLAHRRSLSLLGDPLHGMQLLGMLETRNLDFDTLLLLSANEGVLPSGRSANSLIPFSLKRAFDLPTYREKDAVYANHFYNLLQRARHTEIIYHTEAESMGKGEPSRYVMQLREELVPSHPNITLESVAVRAADSPSATAPLKLSAAKTPAVMQSLRALAAEGLSPTALNLYRSCQLSFYYRYLLHVSEPAGYDEEIDPSGLGTCVHSVLQGIYTPMLRRGITAAELRYAIDHCGDKIDKWFATKYGDEATSTGRNHLTAQIAKSQVRRFLVSELRRLEHGDSINVVEVELKMQHPIALPDGTTATLIGTADRIEISNNRYQIADYKTGSVEQAELKATTNGDKAVSDKWFQLMHYAWLYHHTQHAVDELTAGIYPLRSYDNAFMPATTNGDATVNAQSLDYYEQQLTDLLTTLMDERQPFVGRRNARQCGFCPMNSLCLLCDDSDTAPSQPSEQPQ